VYCAEPNDSGNGSDRWNVTVGGRHSSSEWDPRPWIRLGARKSDLLLQPVDVDHSPDLVDPVTLEAEDNVAGDLDLPAERFIAAARSGDLVALEDLLTADVTAWMDAGPSTRRAVRGRDEVCRLAGTALARFAPRALVAEANGAPALLFVRADELLGVTVFDIDKGRIHAIRTIIDLRKLAWTQRCAPELLG
jgi:hypothetical protein